MIKFGRVYLKRVDEEDLEWLMHERNEPELRRFFRQPNPLNYREQKDWFDSFVGLAYVVVEDNI